MDPHERLGTNQSAKIAAKFFDNRQNYGQYNRASRIKIPISRADCRLACCKDISKTVLLRLPTSPICILQSEGWNYETHFL